MLDPYDFVRYTTFLIATVWTVRGAARTWSFYKRWEERLLQWGVSPLFLRRAVLAMVARITVLDPINLALMLTLVGVWTFRARM
ncbi:MAG: hypothetical protein AAF682_05250 [Planctomycetota bacterium]